jgi:nicotinamidase-related amidase
MRRPALLIIDMQNDFVQEDAPLRVAGARAVIPNVLRVLEAFRRRSLPVFHVVRVHRADGSDVEIIRKERFRTSPFAVEGTIGAAIIPDLIPAPGEYILKKVRMSAFLQTELDLILRSLGVDTVVIAGIQTPNCIRTTAFDAVAYNYVTFLVQDAVAAQTPEIHASNVQDMRNIGIGDLSSDELEGFLSTTT